MRLWLVALSSLLTTTAMAGTYDTWLNGPQKRPDFFPIAVWWQDPLTDAGGAYSSQPAAAEAEGINIYLGIAGSGGGLESPFPEHFGHDDGEFAVLKAHHLYLVSGLFTPVSENTSLRSVANVQAAAAAADATTTLIGYNIGDEPSCGTTSGPSLEQLPTAVSTITSYDKTRPMFDNFLPWALTPEWSNGCMAMQRKGLAAISIASFDLYPITNPWFPASLGTGGSDFISVPNDTLFEQGLTIQSMLDNAPAGKPLWAYVESGSDNLGFSSAVNFTTANVSGTRLTNTYSWTKFTSTWLGLTVSGPGIPAGTKIVSVLDQNTAVLSAAVTPANNVRITVGGGAAGNNGDCVASANLCVVQGNAMRPTAEQVNAEVWMSIIAGATGIEYFCHDSTSTAFCLGGSSTVKNELARATQLNLKYIDGNVSAMAPVLNSPTFGMCSLRRINSQSTVAGVGGTWTTTRSCNNRALTLTTSNTAVPARGIVKNVNGITYLLVQSDQRSSNGATFTYAVTKMANKRATIIYDSNEHYRPARSSLNQTFTLDGAGAFSDTLGAYDSHYQIKIYSIQDGATSPNKKRPPTPSAQNLPRRLPIHQAPF